MDPRNTKRKRPTKRLCRILHASWWGKTVGHRHVQMQLDYFAEIAERHKIKSMAWIFDAAGTDCTQRGLTARFVALTADEDASHLVRGKEYRMKDSRVYAENAWPGVGPPSADVNCCGSGKLIPCCAVARHRPRRF